MSNVTPANFAANFDRLVATMLTPNRTTHTAMTIQRKR